MFDPVASMREQQARNALAINGRQATVTLSDNPNNPLMNQRIIIEPALEEIHRGSVQVTQFSVTVEKSLLLSNGDTIALQDGSGLTVTITAKAKELSYLRVYLAVKV